MFVRRSHHTESFSKNRATKATSKPKRSFGKDASSMRKTERHKKPESPGVGRYELCNLIPIVRRHSNATCSGLVL